MDKIKKALNRLNQKEKETVKSAIKELLNNDFSRLDIKKLKGRRDIYRVRKGKIRIIYHIDSQRNIFILAIERRNDNTYKS